MVAGYLGGIFATRKMIEFVEPTEYSKTLEILVRAPGEKRTRANIINAKIAEWTTNISKD